jgi:hypothetical protein
MFRDDFNPEDIFRMFFTGMQRGGRGHEMDLDDLIGGLFAGMGQMNGPR